MARAETLGQTGRMEGDHAQLLLRSWRSPGGIWAQVQEWWGSALSALGTVSTHSQAPFSCGLPPPAPPERGVVGGKGSLFVLPGHL